jgi:hypothetical protein
MMKPGRQARNWAHSACFSAAIVAVLLLVIGTSLWHKDAPGSEATCAICHVAHLTPLLGPVVGALSAPLFIAWHQPVEAQIDRASPPTVNAPPRAPPV